MSRQRGGKRVDVRPNYNAASQAWDEFQEGTQGTV